MFAIHKPLSVVTSLVTSMALVAITSRQPLLAQTPAAEPGRPIPLPAQGSCAPEWQGSTVVRSTSAKEVIGGRSFTIDMRSAHSTGESGTIAGSQLHWVVQRDAALSMDFELRGTAGGDLDIHVRLGEGFHGPKDLAFTSVDRRTLTGSIDGQPIAPFDLSAPPDTMTLADGSPPPKGSVDGDVKAALPKLLEAVKNQCAGPAPQQSLALTLESEPAHSSNPGASGGCVGCLIGAELVFAACMVAAAISAAACLIFYPICFAVLAAGCAAALFVTLCSGCHLFVGVCGGGGPCCPVRCADDKCCDSGESCAGTVGLCCSPGLSACGASNCCSPSDGCLANGTCCPRGNLVCNGQCCPSAVTLCLPATGGCCLGTACGNRCCNPTQTCTNSVSSTCCDTEHACGAVCCGQSESCADPIRGTCKACDNCSGPGQECCFGVCCNAPAFCNPEIRQCQIIG